MKESKTLKEFPFLNKWGNTVLLYFLIFFIGIIEGYVIGTIRHFEGWGNGFQFLSIIIVGVPSGIILSTIWKSVSPNPKIQTIKTPITESSFEALRILFTSYTSGADPRSMENYLRVFPNSERAKEILTSFSGRENIWDQAKYQAHRHPRERELLKEEIESLLTEETKT